LLRISPNAFPATRYNTHKDPGDEAPVDYVQVRETQHAL
jgi:Arf-GAP/SH3 domain/ANK repeat/PH domain-containing protein